MLTLSVAHKQMIAQDTPEASQFLLSVDSNSGGGEPYGYTMLLLDVAESVLSALGASTPQASAATPTPTAHLLTLASTLQAAAFRLVSSRLEHIYGFVSENDVKMASRQERSVRGLLQDPALTYGEVSAGPFLVALREARAGCHSLPGTTTTTTTTTSAAAAAAPSPPPISGCMVDAGSGAGRGLMVAALAADFAVCRGIELLEGLHMIACEAGRRYGVLTHCDAQRHALLLQAIHSHQQHITTSTSTSTSTSISRHRGGVGGNNLGVLLLTLPPTPPPPAVMVLHLGSFLDPTPTGGGAPCIIGGSPGASDHPPWPLAADVLFANSTCYPEEPHLRRLGVLMGEFAREGSVAITLTRPLSPFHPHLAPLGATKVHFSWGEATLFLHRVGRGASGAGAGAGGGGGATSTSSIRRGGSPSTKSGVAAASAPSRFNRDLDYISSMAHHGEAGAAAAASALAAAVQAMQSKSPPSVLDGWAMTAPPPHPIPQHPLPSRGGDTTFEEEGEEEEEEEVEEEGEEDEYYVEEEEEETGEEESVKSSVGVQQLPTPRPSSVMALLSEMYVAARQEVAEQRREEGLPSLPSTTLSDRGSVVSSSQASSSVYEHQPSRLQRSPSSQHTKHLQQQQQEQEQQQQARNDELSLIGAMATHLLGSGRKESKSPSPTRSPPPSHSKYSHSPSAATGATAAAATAAARQSSPPLPTTPSSATPLPAASTPPPSHTRLVSIRHGWAAEVALRDLAEGRGWGGGVEDAIWPGDPFMHTTTTTTSSGDEGSLSIRVEQHSQRRSSGRGTISSPQGASLQERKWRRTQEISSPQGASLQERKWRKSQGQWDDGGEGGEGGEEGEGGDDGEESVSGLREAVAMGFDDEAAGMNSTNNSSSSRRSDMDLSGVSRREGRGGGGGGGGGDAGASFSHIHADLISSPQGATLQEIKWRRRAEAMTEGGGGAGVYDLGDEGEDTGDEGSAGNTTLGGGSEDSSWPAQLIPGQRNVLVGAK